MNAVSAVCAAICSRCVAGIGRTLAAVRVARDTQPVTELDTTANRDTWDGKDADELAALRVVIDGRRAASARRAETLRTAYLAQTATREGDDA